MINSHATILFLSYLAFLVAVVTGVVFLLQDSLLKRKDSRVLSWRWVPLEILDKINLWAVAVGFALFTFGFLQGLFLARVNWGSFWTWDAKEIWSLVTWIAYALVLGLRVTVGLKGKRVVLMSVVSFLLVMFTFVGVNHLAASRHVF